FCHPFLTVEQKVDIDIQDASFVRIVDHKALVISEVADNNKTMEWYASWSTFDNVSSKSPYPKMIKIPDYFHKRRLCNAICWNGFRLFSIFYDDGDDNYWFDNYFQSDFYDECHKYSQFVKPLDLG